MTTPFNNLIPASKIAMLIFTTSTCVRFSSMRNKKLFSLAIQDDDSFDFVELLNDTPYPDRTDMRTIYQGWDFNNLRRKIAKELTA